MSARSSSALRERILGHVRMFKFVSTEVGFLRAHTPTSLFSTSSRNLSSPVGPSSRVSPSSHHSLRNHERIFYLLTLFKADYVCLLSLRPLSLVARLASHFQFLRLKPAVTSLLYIPLPIEYLRKFEESIMSREEGCVVTASAPVCVGDVERLGTALLPRAALDYYRSGAGEELTLRNNREAFRRLRIRPRVLRDVSHRNLSTTALGDRVAIPFGIAPTAMHRMAHPDGEVAVARAAERMGAVFILSTLSTSSLEEVAEGAPKATKWFQLYIYKNRSVTQDLVMRAERLGYKALVLTVDAPVFGIRWADARNKFHLPPHLKLANFTRPTESDGVRERTDTGSQLQAYVTDLFDQSLTWDAISWLKSITKLPIILKGILAKEDVEEALKYDISGIMVSNHGARQVDGFPATVEALPEIVQAVGGRCEVYLDGGVTQGTDVFKALALGARMVFCGRPALWGLAYNGEDGVKTVLDIIRNEFDFTLALTGCASIGDIKREMVVPASYYSVL